MLTTALIDDYDYPEISSDLIISFV